MKPNVSDNTSDNISDDEVIDLFIDGLIEKKGLKIPTPEIRQDLHSKLKNQLLTEIDRSIIAELPDNKLEELTSSAANTGELSPEAVANAVREANLDVTEITGVTMQRFGEMYLKEPQKNTAEV